MDGTITTLLRWTSKDLESLPDNGKRYEIVDGELYVSQQPHWYHQYICSEILARICEQNKSTEAGFVTCAPGLIFDDDDDVAPDLVWISNSRLAAALEPDGKLHAAPELVVEVLSPGLINDRRDREAKLKLYSRRGVIEYWIVDWRLRQIELYRRENAQLHLVATLHEGDTLESPLLPQFSLSVADLFQAIPRDT